MKPFPIEELVDRCGSRFTVVVAAAKRAKQIKEGAPPLVNLPTRNPLTIALHEIAAGLIEITDEPVIIEELAVIAAEEGLGELAEPEIVEALIGKAIADEVAEEAVLEVAAEDTPEVELDEEIAADLDEDAEEDDDEDDDEDLELDEDDDDWEEDDEAEEAEE